MFSYADNTTLSIVGSSSPTELERGTGSAPPRPSGCPEGQEFLANENIRVGLLFASKALVQLVVNPAVGVLTNRWVRDPGLSRGAALGPGGSSLLMKYQQPSSEGLCCTCAAPVVTESQEHGGQKASGRIYALKEALILPFLKACKFTVQHKHH